MTKVGLRMLGSFRGEVAGEPANLGPARQRAVLAMLVGAGGRVVTTDGLIDGLWGGRPPATALASLQVYVSNLRRVLEPRRPPRAPASVLVSAVPGYRLCLDSRDVDAWRFRELAYAAFAEQDRTRAVAIADEALELWEGPAYAEFAHKHWAAPEAAQLEELRRATVEHRAEAALDLGWHAQIIPALEQHTRDHPFRENAARLLALACYRSGRQGDALAVIARTRRLLVHELGVDPGPGLRELESAILAQSRSLDLVSPQPLRLVATVPSRRRTPAHRLRRPWSRYAPCHRCPP
jgi:DNA-binding SARP family transcriptional activator